MKIGIIVAGKIGATLARKLAASGHEVKLSNSKGWTPFAISNAAPLVLHGRRMDGRPQSVHDASIKIV